MYAINVVVVVCVCVDCGVDENVEAFSAELVKYHFVVFLSLHSHPCT